jgi:hypothetical protein
VWGSGECGDEPPGSGTTELVRNIRSEIWTRPKQLYVQNTFHENPSSHSRMIECELKYITNGQV